jgi:hypothetical protein
MLLRMKTGKEAAWTASLRNPEPGQKPGNPRCLFIGRCIFGIWKNTSETAAEIIQAAREEHEIIELLGEIKVRQTRFQGNRVIEVCPSTFEQIRD